MAEQQRRRSNRVLGRVLASVVVSALAACGGNGDGDLSADSVASKIADQTPYTEVSCSEEADGGEGDGASFTCSATTPPGGVVGPGLDATIIVIEQDDGLMATATVEGEIVDAFSLD